MNYQKLCLLCFELLLYSLSLDHTTSWSKDLILLDSFLESSHIFQYCHPWDCFSQNSKCPSNQLKYFYSEKKCFIVATSQQLRKNMEEENEHQNSFCCVSSLFCFVFLLLLKFALQPKVPFSSCRSSRLSLQRHGITRHGYYTQPRDFSLSNLACLQSMLHFDLSDYSHEIQLQFVKPKGSVFRGHFSRNCSKAWYQTPQKQHSAWHPQQPRVPRILCSQQYTSNHLPSSSVFPYPYPSYVCAHD